MFDNGMREYVSGVCGLRGVGISTGFLLDFCDVPFQYFDYIYLMTF